MTRRESFVGHTVVYAAVGASNAPDLLRFPPEGATPFAEELRLGSGPDRFLLASSVLMTWGAQRAHGIDVIEVAEGDGGQYSGVTFDASGVPQPGAIEDLQFSPDGVPYLRAGSVVRMSWTSDRESLQFRVVYTVDESHRTGFALGSADEASVPGEVRYLVEHREDDSVWGTAVGFLYPASTGLLGWKGRNAVRSIIAEIREQLAGLAPGGVAHLIDVPANPVSGEGSEAASEVSGDSRDAEPVLTATSDTDPLDVHEETAPVDAGSDETLRTSDSA